MVKFISWNINGCGNPAKRKKILTYLKHKQADIVFVQESHLKDEEALKFKRGWVGQVFSSSFNSKQNGVIILINKRLSFVMLGETKDEAGRIICVDALINGVKVVLCNVYAPNKDDPIFINEVNRILGAKEGHIIAAGDWNQVICPVLDRSKYRATAPPRDRTAIHMLMEDVNLVDVWRLVNPNEKEYTFYSHCHKVHTRIDFYLISKSIIKDVIDSKIGTIALSDHALVELNIDLNTETGRKGRWRMNTMLLQDELFCAKLSEDLTFFFDTNVGSTETIATVWDASKAFIRGKLIAQSSKKKKESIEQVRKLENEIGLLEKDLAEHYTEEVYKELCKCKFKLNGIYNKKTEYALFRLRTNFYEGGEKTGKLLARQLKQKDNNSVIPAIKKGDNIVSSTKEINGVFQKFYENLYTSTTNHEQGELEDFLSKITLPTMTAQQAESLDAPITEKEVRNAIAAMKVGKSPGHDGFPIEYFKKFIDILAPILTKVYLEAFKLGTLPCSFNEALITLIPKKGRDTMNPSNYRPLSLINVDCKLLTKILASRLDKVLPDIVLGDQVGFLKGRTSNDNLRRLLHLTWRHAPGATPVAALSLDAEQAFDRSGWAFMRAAMSRFGFGQGFITWFNILYKNPKAAVITNGLISPFFNITRSLRQGCSLSPLLFTIFLEPLAAMIRANTAIKGVEGGGKEHKLMLFADDILLLIKDPVASLPPLMDTIQTYSSMSGYKINWSKSEAMPISKTCYSYMVTQFGFRWVPVGMKYLGIKLTPDLDKIITLNYEPLLTMIKNNLEKWSALKLSLWGKVNVIKMVVAPQFNYFSAMLPLNIPDRIFKEYDKIIRDFLWEKKKPRIKLSKMWTPRDKGGLGLPDMRTYNISFEMAKLSKHWCGLDSELDWVMMERDLASPFSPIDALSQTEGTEHNPNPIISHSRNVWGKIHKAHKLTHYKQSYSSLWNNPKICIGKKKIFWKKWHTAGIKNICDLFDDGNFITLATLKERYDVGNDGTLWKYLQTRHCLGNTFNVGENPILDYLKLPHDAHTASLFYRMSKQMLGDTCENLKLIWQRDLGIDFEDNHWESIIANAGNGIREARGKFTQYKIIHRYYYTPTRLQKMGIADNNMCWKCKEEVGTYMHMIWECRLVNPFWGKVLESMGKWVQQTLPLQPRLCLLGDKKVVPGLNKNAFTIIKVGLVTAARIIMRNWKAPRMPGFNEWNDEMIKITSYEYMLGRVSGESKMKDTWDSFWVYMNIK